ncbi:hypothetical protein HK102_003325, partial [Quaeritorhiza haematococci]
MASVIVNGLIDSILEVVFARMTRLPNRPPELVNVSFYFTYNDIYRDGAHSESRVSPVYQLKDVPVDLVDARVNDAVRDIAFEMFLTTGYEPDVVAIHHQLVVNPPEPVPELHDPMFAYLIVKLPYAFVDQNFDHAGQCVISALSKAWALDHHTVHGMISFSVHLLDQRPLWDFRELKGAVRLLIQKNPNGLLDIAKGFTALHVQNVCKLLRTSMYMLNRFLQPILKYVSPIKNKNRDAVVFIKANNHMYPVVDRNERIRLVNLFKEQTKCHVGTGWIYESKPRHRRTECIVDPTFEELLQTVSGAKELPEHRYNMVFTKGHSLEGLYVELFKATQTLFEVGGYHGHVTKIKIDCGGSKRVRIVLQHDYDTIVFNCQQLHIPFNDQSLVNLAMEHFDIYCEGHRVHSQMNRDVEGLFRSYRKTPFHFTFSAPTVPENVKAHDIVKCYPASLKDNRCPWTGRTFPWLVFGCFDEIRPFSGTIRDTCVYYVNTESFFPGKGNGLYFPVEIHNFQWSKIPFKIKYEIEASSTLPHDFFADFIDTWFEKCKEPKAAMVQLIGAWQREHRIKEQHMFTLSHNDASQHYHTCKKDGIEVIITRMSELPELLHIVMRKKEFIFDSMLPIHAQLTGNSHVRLHHLAQLATRNPNARLLQLKTDAVYVENGSPIQYINDDLRESHKIGGYRPLLVDRDCNWGLVSNAPAMAPEFTHEPRQWTSINPEDLEGTSFLLTGRAGTGKTFFINQACQRGDFGKNILRAAPTNKAARLVNGETLHSLLSINGEGQVKDTQLVNKLLDIDSLIIDECSMISALVWSILYRVHRTLPHLNFGISGDFDQLPPVENVSYDYENSTMLKELVDGRRATLTMNKRSDPDMWEVFDGIDSLSITEFGSSITERNICRTHRTQKALNAHFMRLKKVHSATPTLFVPADANDSLTQDVFLSNGTPVVAVSNQPKLGFVNCDTFKVVFVANDGIVLEGTQ